MFDINRVISHAATRGTNKGRVRKDQRTGRKHPLTHNIL